MTDSFNRGDRGPTGDHGQDGTRGATGADGARGPRGRTGWGEWARWIMCMAAVVIATFSVYNLNAESADRREQVCQNFESDHLRDVQGLVNTYQYFQGFTKEQLLASRIDSAIFKQLPQTEATADQDPAPEFCDEAGVALPEPDPCIPTRPPRIAAMAEEFGLPGEPPHARKKDCTVIGPTL